MDKLLTVKEGAARIKRTKARVIQLIAEGSIKAERFGKAKRTVRIRESEIQRYIRDTTIPDALPAIEESKAA